MTILTVPKGLALRMVLSCLREWIGRALLEIE